MDDVYHCSGLWYAFNNIPYADYEEAKVTWAEEDLKLPYRSTGLISYSLETRMVVT
jgi:hypothetical protein